MINPLTQEVVFNQHVCNVQYIRFFRGYSLISSLFLERKQNENRVGRGDGNFATEERWNKCAIIKESNIINPYIFLPFKIYTVNNLHYVQYLIRDS